MLTIDFLGTYQNKLETNQIKNWLYYHHQNIEWTSNWHFPDCKYLQYFWFQIRQQIICFFDYLESAGSSKTRLFKGSLTPKRPQRKTDQTVKKPYLLKNYTSPVIFKRWCSTDVYKECYEQKAMRIRPFPARSKMFLKYCHELFFQ